MSTRFDRTNLIGGSSSDLSWSVTLGNDDSIYKVGHTYSNFDNQKNYGSLDGFITKFNSSGDKEWTKLISDTGCFREDPRELNILNDNTSCFRDNPL